MKWLVETVGDEPISIYGEHSNYHSHGGSLSGADIIMRHVISATTIVESASSNSDYTKVLEAELKRNIGDNHPVTITEKTIPELATRLNSAIKVSQNCV